MAIKRCIGTRIAEAVHIKLLADDDLLALCGAAKIQFGPINLEHLLRGAVNPRQVNVLPGASGLAKGAEGVSGRTETEYVVNIVYFDRFEPQPVATGGEGGELGMDVMAHIGKLLREGDPDNANPGRLLDPDRPEENPTPAEKYITLGIRNERTAQPRVTANGVAVWLMSVTFFTFENEEGVRV